MSKTAKPIKFEEALKRLEEIVGKMETGDLALDDALHSFEEGIGLAKFCEQKLNEAEGKIEKLLKASDGGESGDIIPLSGEDEDR